MSGLIFLTKGLIVPTDGIMQVAPYAKNISITKKPQVSVSVKTTSVTVKAVKTIARVKVISKFGAKVRAKKKRVRLV